MCTGIHAVPAEAVGVCGEFEELGRSFHDEARIVGDDRQSILEKCLLQQSRQVMGIICRRSHGSWNKWPEKRCATGR